MNYTPNFRPAPKPEPKPKKGKKPLKRTRVKYKKRDSGQIEIFEEIAAEREWRCFVTDEKLWQLTATQFLHVLPKGLNKFPKYKNYKPNIVLATNEVHFKWDHTPRSELKKDPRFDKLFKLESELKDQYPKMIY